MTNTNLQIRTLGADELDASLERWWTFLTERGETSLSRHPAWLAVLEEALGHRPYMIEATSEGRTVGLLPLVFVASRLFGRFLVGLSYLNVGGVVTDESAVAAALIDEAVALADRLDADHLQLRHEREIVHPKLTESLTSKVHSRLELPETSEVLWKSLKPKVRNQIRKAMDVGLEVAWGREDLSREFYAVFARNMRDLGTPVYGRGLFDSVLRRFPDSAELCVVRLEQRPIAAGLLLHGPGTTEVPSASSLRQFNATCANMLLYWHFLERAVERGQAVFDFGRSSVDSGTFRFKKQWGAQPRGAVWQHYVRRGTVNDARPDNPRWARMIRLWQRLPVPMANLIGPSIVRRIP